MFFVSGSKYCMRKMDEITASMHNKWLAEAIGCMKFGCLDITALWDVFTVGIHIGKQNKKIIVSSTGKEVTVAGWTG